MIVLTGFATMNIALYLVLPMDAMRSKYTVVVVRISSHFSLLEMLTDLTRTSGKCFLEVLAP